MRQTYDRFFAEQASRQGYVSCGELMDDLWLALEGMLLMALELVRECGTGISELPCRCEEYQHETAGYRREIERIRLHIGQRVEKTAPTVRLPFLAFARRLAPGGWQKLCLLLGGACDRKPNFGNLLAALQEDPARRYATKGLVWSLAVLAGGSKESLYGEMLAEQEFLRLCFLKSEPVLGEGIWEAPLVLKRRLFYHFHGYRSGLSQDAALRLYDPTGRNGRCFSERQCAALIRLLDAGPDPVCLLGRAGSGRKFLMKQISEQSGRPVLFVPYPWLQRQPDISVMYDLLYLELLLERGYLCLTDCERETEPGKSGAAQREILTGLLSYMKIRGETVVLTASGRPGEGFMGGIGCRELFLEEPGRTQREAVWRYFLERAGADAGLAAEGSRYVLNVGEIKRAVNRAIGCAVWEGREGADSRDVRQAAGSGCGARLGMYAQLLRSSVCLDDLVTAAGTRELLGAFCARIRYGKMAGEEWGCYGCAAGGRGVCALFYGPPGTGKTMAAQAIANELGLELYRVDLGGMMSKYIGETEKNISRLFARAAHGNALLFFDEADALFSGRTKVQDSHDRSANREVSHLLQKLEAYDGVCILATNLRDNLDDAFSRRIRYMIPFPFPDVSMRRALWKKCCQRARLWKRRWQRTGLRNSLNCREVRSGRCGCRRRYRLPQRGAVSATAILPGR